MAPESTEKQTGQHAVAYEHENPLNPGPESDQTAIEANPLVPTLGQTVIVDIAEMVQELDPPAEPQKPMQNNFNPGSGRVGIDGKPVSFPKNDVQVAPDQVSDVSLLLASIVEQRSAGSARGPVFNENRPEPAFLTSKTEIPSGPSCDERRVPERLNLADFDVAHFEYKTESENPVSPVLQSAQLMQMMRTSMPVREFKPVKPLASETESLAQGATLNLQRQDSPPTVAGPEAVRHVTLVFEPPPPPPVVRSVVMHIGDAESQVSVVIRERNGNLNVQLGTANERLKEDLQSSSPLLMRELERNNPMAVTVDFSHFGSATDANRQPRSQAQAKKFLKSQAEFADVVESAYLPPSSSPLKSL